VRSPALGRWAECRYAQIALAPRGDFLARLFGIEAEVAACRQRAARLAPLFACKRRVVQRKALNR
jgi:hypothetical protein